MRYRFVDKIIDLEPGNTIHSQYTWPKELEIFEDHFPGFPVVPGVLITEMMGQTAGLCIESSKPELGSAMLIQIKKATFKNWIKPGWLLDIHARVISIQPRLARIEARTEHEGELMASTELLFSFADKKILGLPEVDPVLSTFLKRIK
jgi:3-hydroxyacyl-[acyl-carrier-protein] dehydratase